MSVLFTFCVLPAAQAAIGIDSANVQTNCSATYDSGSYSVANSHPINHDFTILNRSGAPIRIGRVQAACGCTSAKLDIGSPGNYEPVDSGKSFTVRVSVDPSRLFGVTFDKVVWIYLVGRTAPAVTLHMVGKINPGVKFEPDVLDFGTVRLGSNSSRSLTETLDSAVYGRVPGDPLSNSPDVIVTRMLPDPAPVAGLGLVRRRYSIRIARNAHLGVLQANISIPILASLPQAAPYSAKVTGRVVGSFAASESSIAFGTTYVGESSTQFVVLTSTDQSTLDALSVSCHTPTVTVKLIKNDPNNSHVGVSNVMLEVSFAPTVAGPATAQVEIRTVTGEELELPILAYSLPARHPAQ
jgi:hypothetical protein